MTAPMQQTCAIRSRPLKTSIVGRATLGGLTTLITLITLMGGCSRALDVEAAALRPPTRPRVTPHTEAFGECESFTEDRQVLFGDLHVHTAYSLDANLQGARVEPPAAYRFARGEAIGIPPMDAQGRPTRQAQLQRPLDFMAVTDHAEYLGVIGACTDPESDAYTRAGCRWFRNRPEDAYVALNYGLARPADRVAYPGLCGRGATDCVEHQAELWVALQDAAEEAQDRTPACRFTSLMGYEWTASPSVDLRRASNLHRNVIFRNGIVPALPIEYIRAPDIATLWQRLERECIDADNGCDALAIPHNSNLSAQQMFLPWERGRGIRDTRTFSRGHAARRARMEPLMEIYQHKGSSECVPGGLTGDEDCGFELIPYSDIASASRDRRSASTSGGTLRTAAALGMGIEREIGINPFRIGFIASTDTHVGLGGAVDEGRFLGAGGAGGRQAGGFPDRVFFSGGGLAAVWAEENSREGIFRALRRREVYGTSGPRITVRTYAGWELPSDWCTRTDRARAGYQHGVPMGGVLRPLPRIDPHLEGPPRGPQLAIAAARDAESVGLQEVQIVKGWLDADGAARIQVYPVDGMTASDDRVNLNTCEATGGLDQVCGVWRDPDFDPALSAYYYVRVLEIPTCRWTTRMCVEAEYDCEGNRAVDRACCDESTGLYPRGCATTQCDESNRDHRCCQPDVVRPIVQERAWTSPIWYTP